MRELFNIIPDKGNIAFFIRKAKTSNSIKWVNIGDDNFKQDVEDIIAKAINDKHDCYFTPATFSLDTKNELHKTKNNADTIKCLFLDIDCHGQNPDEYYNTLDEAKFAFNSISNFLGLKPTYIIYSGNGLQPVWVLDSPIKIKDWLDLSYLLFDIFCYRELKLDRNVRGDASKMLRVPSSFNTRWNKIVEIEEVNNKLYSPMRLYNLLKDYTDKHKVPAAIKSNREPNKKDSLPAPDLSNDDYNQQLLRWMLRYIPSSFNNCKIPNDCSSYQMWVNTIWAIKSTGLENAWEAAKEWASGASDEYPDYEEALKRVWDTDDQSKDNNGKISYGSLLYIFRFYHPDEKIAKTYNFIKKEATKVGKKATGTVLNPGSPNSELPHPFTHIKDRKGIFIIREGGADQLPIPILFLDRDIELLDVISPPPNYTANPVCLIHLLIHPSLYSDHPVEMKIPTYTLADEKALSKIFAGACIIPEIRNKWTTMSKYLQSLINQHRNRSKNKFIVEQAGWSNDNKSFYLGSHNILTDKTYKAELSPNVEVILNGVGDVSGDIKTYLQILNAFNSHDHMIQQAIMVLMLGSPLCKFSSSRAATVYTYDRSTGTGKTFAHLVGLSFFGNPRYMMIGGDSTFNAINQSRMRYSDIPLYIDEFKIVLDRRNSSKGLAESKDFLLRSSTGKEKNRSSRDGQSFISKGLYWNSPLFVSCNVPFSSLIESDYTSQAATYARVMLIDYSQYMRKSPIRSYIGDKDLEILLSENYGYIGRHFLKYVIGNLEEIKSQVRQNYKILNDRSTSMGRHNQHRFHNTTISCALTVIEYLEKYNLVPNWDLNELRAFLPSLADTTNTDASKLLVNDHGALFSKFISEQTKYTFEVDRQNSPPCEIMLTNGKQYVDTFHIVIFKNDGLCWVKVSALKDFCKKYNADYRALSQFMFNDTSINAIAMRRVNFTANAKNLNTDICDVVVVPLKAIRASLVSESPNESQNKIVPIR